MSGLVLYARLVGGADAAELHERAPPGAPEAVEARLSSDAMQGPPPAPPRPRAPAVGRGERAAGAVLVTLGALTTASALGLAAAAATPSDPASSEFGAGFARGLARGGSGIGVVFSAVGAGLWADADARARSAMTWGGDPRAAAATQRSMRAARIGVGGTLLVYASVGAIALAAQSTARDPEGAAFLGTTAALLGTTGTALVVAGAVGRAPGSEGVSMRVHAQLRPGGAGVALAGRF